ncbi:hypothetical protein G7046_g854 [Stylonectria norvegica]|nr:hypothetical protein G7046_g854 [Stylonectria norvegica]
MTHSSTLFLSSLSPREAIIDALSRALISCDRHDTQLFNSAWAGEDVVFEIHDGDTKVLPNRSLIRTHVLDRVGPMDTTHNVSNVRVDVKDGADTAFLTATSLAQHCPSGRGKEPDGPKYLVGGQYSLDLVRDEAKEWRIKKCVLEVIWTQGDASIMQSPN